MNRNDKMKEPIHIEDVPWIQWSQGTPQAGRGKALCDEGGTSHIGFGLMELPPGCNTEPAHYHYLEEEHLYVLEGQAILRLGDKEYELRWILLSYFVFSSSIYFSDLGPFLYRDRLLERLGMTLSLANHW